jgi:HSP90 family molecular chaperone
MVKTLRLGMFVLLFSELMSRNTFYNQYNTYLKIGAIKDTANRARILKLLRWTTAKSDGKV